MTGEVTRGGGLPGLSGKITLSVGVTICHVNGSGGGGHFHGKKALKQNVCFKTLYISQPSHGRNH